MQRRLVILMEAEKIGRFDRKARGRYFSEAASGAPPDLASSATGVRAPADMARVLSIVRISSEFFVRKTSTAPTSARSQIARK